MSTNVIPERQKAWQVVRRGHPSNAVVLNNDAPVPSELNRGQVLVKVYAGALNPVGYKMMKMLPNLVARRPHVAEHDIAGIVVDPNGSQFQKGDEVFGWITMPMTSKTGQGALSQYTRLPEDHITHPSALRRLQPGQTVFVNGGSSSVGSFAIQIAKAKGCKVVATCSTANVEMVKDLGADEVIDYKRTPVPQHFQTNPPTPKFHVIFDTVTSSAELLTSSPAYLAPNGVFVSVGITNGFSNAIVGFSKTMLWPAWIGGTNRQHRIIAVHNKKEDLEALRSLVERDNVKPSVDSVYAFEDVHKAYGRIMTGRAKGIIVTVV